MVELRPRNAGIATRGQEWNAHSLAYHPVHMLVPVCPDGFQQFVIYWKSTFQVEQSPLPVKKKKIDVVRIDAPQPMTTIDAPQQQSREPGDGALATRDSMESFCGCQVSSVPNPTTHHSPLTHHRLMAWHTPEYGIKGAFLFLVQSWIPHPSPLSPF